MFNYIVKIKTYLGKEDVIQSSKVCAERLSSMGHKSAYKLPKENIFLSNRLWGRIIK